MIEVLYIIYFILLALALFVIIPITYNIWADTLYDIRERKEKRRFERECEENRRRIIELQKEGKL